MIFIVKRAVRLRLLTEKKKNIAWVGKYYTFLHARLIAFCGYLGLLMLLLHILANLRYLLNSYIVTFVLVADLMVTLFLAKSGYYEETKAYVKALGPNEVIRIAKKDKIFIWIWASMYILSSTIIVIEAM